MPAAHTASVCNERKREKEIPETWRAELEEKDYIGIMFCGFTF